MSLVRVRRLKPVFTHNFEGIVQCSALFQWHTYSMYKQTSIHIHIMIGKEVDIHPHTPMQTNSVRYDFPLTAAASSHKMTLPPLKETNKKKKHTFT